VVKLSYVEANTIEIIDLQEFYGFNGSMPCM